MGYTRRLVRTAIFIALVGSALAAVSPALAAGGVKPRAVPGISGVAPIVARSAGAGPGAQIIGGSTAPAGAYPYAVFVQADYMLGTQEIFQYCSGTLVAPNVVLTAGHCAFDDAQQPLQPGFYTVAIGVSDLATATSVTERGVVAIHVYPYFNPATLQGDVSLLVLSAPAGAGSAVIPLATSANAALYAAGAPVTAIGWGLTSNAPGSEVSDTLQVGNEAMQANATCQAAQPTGFHPGFDLCANAAGFLPTTCNGDSGGPLIASTAAGPVEVGITSYGLTQACGGSPDYFARATSIQPWVASVIVNTLTPPAFVPPFIAPAPTAALAADGVTVSIPPPAADPATLQTGYTVSLVSSLGAVVSTQSLPPTATTASFPSLHPGTYTATVSAAYTEGASPAAAAAPVVLAPPANAKKPLLTGPETVGKKLTCHPGTWVWPGPYELTRAWLRNGKVTGQHAVTYPLTAADAGTRIACRVVLDTSTGSEVVAVTPSAHVAVRLVSSSLPKLEGAPTVGARLTCRAGTFSHTGTLKISYRWLRDAKPVTGPGATAARRVVVAADVGKQLACRVTARAGAQIASKTTGRVVARVS